MNGHHQQTNGIQYQQTQQQQSLKDEWSKILDAHPLGGAPNAEQFTKNLISLNFGNPQGVTIPQHQIPPNFINQQQNMMNQQQIPITVPQQQQPAAPAGSSGSNLSAPKRGKGILTQQRPGMRVPMCGACSGQIRWAICCMNGKSV